MQRYGIDEQVDLGKCKVLFRTDKAIQVRLQEPVNGKREYWIPKKCATVSGEGTYPRVLVSKWYWDNLAFKAPPPHTAHKAWIPSKLPRTLRVPMKLPES